MQETPEVIQTSAGHGADPSTTKRDLYAALLNPEYVTEICSAVKAQKFANCLLHAFQFPVTLKRVLTTSKKYYFNPYTVKLIFS